MMSFESADDSESDDDSDGGAPSMYPTKVLVLYKDSKGILKALVYSVKHKMATSVEGPLGDSQLMKHYRLEFHEGSGKPKMCSVPIDNILHVIVACEALQHSEPLVPQIKNLARQDVGSMRS